MDLIQTWYSDRYHRSLYFDTSLIDLGPDSKSQECETAKTYANILQSLQSVRMKFSLLLRSVGVLNLIFKRENPTYTILLIQKLKRWLVCRHLQIDSYDDRDH